MAKGMVARATLFCTEPFDPLNGTVAVLGYPLTNMPIA